MFDESETAVRLAKGIAGYIGQRDGPTGLERLGMSIRICTKGGGGDVETAGARVADDCDARARIMRRQRLCDVADMLQG